MTNRYAVLALALAAFFAVGRPVSASPIQVAEGDSFTVNWACVPGNCQWDTASGSYLPLTATGAFNILDISDGSARIDVTIRNTWVSNDTVLYLKGFGFDIDPNVTGVAGAGGAALTSFSLGDTFPGFKTVEVCADSSAKGSCGAGKASDGIAEGAYDHFVLTLTGGFVQGGTITFDSFAVKMAGDPSSYEFGATSVPEPASLLLLGTGLFGAAALGRRRK